MTWNTFRPAEVERLATGPSFLVEPGERDCPGCGVRRLRTYVQSPSDAKRPTLVSYVWCSGCRKFAGSRARRPDGLAFADPMAGQDHVPLIEFFDRLDRLWDDGVLPQTFARA